MNGISSPFLRCLGMSAALLAASLPAVAEQLYLFEATGVVIPDNNEGTLSHHVGRNWSYRAFFDLDYDNAVGTRFNAMGYEVFQFDDGGMRYDNGACLHDGADVLGGDCLASTMVEVEYNDNIQENWATDPELAFLNLDLEDQAPLDMFVLGFYNPATNIEFYLSLIFDADWVDGYDNLPNTFSLDGLIMGAGEFAQRDQNDDIIGWAQIVMTEANLEEVADVPVPAAAWLFGSALIGLVTIKRKK